MEHAQRVVSVWTKDAHMLSLNPYFNGTCSKRTAAAAATQTIVGVLILILMEHAQREMYRAWFESHPMVLILILMEHAQREHFL